MLARVDSGITFSRTALPPKALELLRKAMSFANPEFAQRLRLGLDVRFTPEVLCYLEERGWDVRLPRGAAGILKEVLAKFGEKIEFEDARLLRGPLLSPSELSLRDYQQRASDKFVRAKQGYVVLPCGGGKCVNESSLIFTDRGLLTAKELAEGTPEGEFAPLFVEVNSSHKGPMVASAVYNGGHSDVIRATLKFGYEIEGTPEHPVRVLRGGELLWVRLDEVQLGDSVAVRLGTGVWGSTHSDDGFSYTHRKGTSGAYEPKNMRLNETMAKAIGLLIAEGTLTHRLHVVFTNSDRDLVSFMGSWAESIGLKLVRKDELNYSVTSVVLREYLSWLGVGYDKSAGKKIPKAVRLAGPEIMSAFLSGLFDGDASIDTKKNLIEFITKSPQLAREVQVALTGLGILCTCRPRTVGYKGERLVFWRVNVYDVVAFEQKVGFISTRLRNKLSEAVENKKAAIKNPNVDVLDVRPLLRELYQTARRSPSWTHSEGRLFGNYVNGGCSPSREKIQRILDRWVAEFPAECMPLQEIIDLPCSFLDVEEIRSGLSARVVDLSVPVAHEFVANGIVCHNTRVGMSAISRIKQPTLVLVMSLDLAEQWRVELSEKLGLEATLVGGGEENVSDVTIAVAQALVRWDQEKLDAFLLRFGMIICDEAHHCPCDSLAKIVDRSPAHFRLGLTATPQREDGLTQILDLYLGEKLIEVQHEELVAAGHLIVPEVQIIETAFSYDYKSQEDYADMLEALAWNEQRNAQIVDHIEREAEAGNVCLALSGRIDHCEHLAAMLNERGVRAEPLTSSVKKKRRKELLEEARRGDLLVLLATSLADEGLDLPRLSRVFLVFPGKAKGRTIQRVGRLMRPHPDKANSILFDFADRKVHILRRHHLERRKLYADVFGIPASQLRRTVNNGCSQ